MAHTVGTTTSRTVRIGIPAIGHGDLVLFKDVSSPHALCVDTSVSAPAESTTEAGFLSFWPAIWAAVFEILLFGRTPAPWGFQMGGIRHGRLEGVGRANKEVEGIEKPFWVFCHHRIGETIWVEMGIGELVKGRMDEKDVWVGGLRVHALRRDSEDVV